MERMETHKIHSKMAFANAEMHLVLLCNPEKVEI